jgi:hypothetical protein
MLIMAKVETIERRIQNYQHALRKLRLQLKIAKIEQEPVAKSESQPKRPLKGESGGDAE